MIYLDHAATTPVSEEVAHAVYDTLVSGWGNPSSQYPIGKQARDAVAAARETIAAALGCKSEQFVFTSCGSESDNWAVRLALHQNRHAGKHIITTAVEHSAILETCKALEQEGYSVTYLKPDKNGDITASQVESALRDDTALVTMMLVNNETGCIFPVAEVAQLLKAKKSRALLHTDAVQAAGHLEIDVGRENIDMLSLSGHKFHGPKGVGALYVRKGIPLTPLIEGGAQERRKRAGTENVAGIVGMAAALKEACDHLPEHTAKVSALRDKLIAGLDAIPHGALNGDRNHRLPGNVSFCFEGIEGESMLLLLDDRGICASSGSACTSGSLDPSHVLLAIGRPHEVAHGSLRLSLCEENTEQEVDVMLREIPQVIDYLRNMSPVWRKLQKGECSYVIQ